MSNFIIGTAGHIDHGKTALVKALTGMDTDRLEEEKKRGITIELGFAYLTLPNGENAGIVDVPGHEKFIKNMLAGASGIDIALLIVAADDGVMPQTREHLGIMSLLGIRQGIIVMTKVDLVDADFLELVEEDIKQVVKGTFLENAPVVPVSALTGQGIDELKKCIFQQMEKTVCKNISAPFRLPVDRVFTMKGFGTVITGTLTEGSLNVGEEIEIYPCGVRCRVRNLQVHAQGVDTAFAGQRVAVNLAGLSKNEIERGDTLAQSGSMQNTLMLDVKLEILNDSKRVIENGSRLHFYHGARETLCKLVLLEQDSLKPGQQGYAQLHFTEELAARKGDRFVVRFYSPMETVGGGVVLSANPSKHRRKNKKVLEALYIKEQGSASENLLATIAEGAPQFTPLSAIQCQSMLGDDAFKAELTQLVDNGSVILLTNQHAIDADYKATLCRTLTQILSDFHVANPLKAGMRQDELRSRLLQGREIALTDKVLDIFVKEGVITLFNHKVALADFKIQYSENDRKRYDAIESIYRESFAPPTIDEVMAMFPKDTKAAKQVVEAMLEEGVLVATSVQIYFHRDVLQTAQSKISEKEQITLAEFRDLFGTSRKFALVILEYFDKIGVTNKTGDIRIVNLQKR